MTRFHIQKLPTYPDATSENKSIDGLVPATKVERWEDLLNVFKDKFFTNPRHEIVFRGHQNHEWGLFSTLGRVIDQTNVPGDLGQEVLNQFKLAMRGRGIDLSTKDDNEVWAIGQHYGLKTPMIDWTKSPFIALFFAFRDYETVQQTLENPSRTIYCLNKTLLDELSDDSDNSILFEPKGHDNTRLVGQAGLFSLIPSTLQALDSYIVQALQTYEKLPTEYNDTNESSRLEHERRYTDILRNYILKIHIPNTQQSRNECLESLRSMNINASSLFPDPQGASSFVNDWISRKLDDLRVKREEHEKQKDAQRRAADKEEKQKTLENKLYRSAKHPLKEYLKVYFQDFEELQSDELHEALDSAIEKAAYFEWQKSQKGRATIRVVILRELRKFNLANLDGLQQDFENKITDLYAEHQIEAPSNDFLDATHLISAKASADEAE